MKEYVKEYKYCFLLVLVFTFVCYGFMLTHFALSIDEETWIMGGNIDGWLRQSRYSLWLYDLLFTKNGNYVPFLYDFLGIIFWNFSGIGLSYTLLKDKKCHPVVLFSALAYYNSLPFVMADIMSFSMYLIQIGIGALCTVYAVYLSIAYISDHRKKKLFLAVILLWWAFGTYQAFICYYISAFAGYCVLEYLTHEKKDIWTKIGIGASICVLGVIGYIGIDKVANMFAGSDGYLQGSYIGWKDENPVLNFLMSLVNVGRVSFAIPYQGVKVNGALCLRVLTIMFVMDAFYRAHFEKKVHEKVLCVFLCAALCFAPFLLYIAMATYKTVGRMMLGLPVIGVVQIYLIGDDLKKKRFQKIGVCFLVYFMFVNAVI